jgi:hypothetical protein
MRGFSGYGGRPIRAKYVVPLEVGAALLVGTVAFSFDASVLHLLEFAAEGVLLVLLLATLMSAALRTLDRFRYTPTELERAGGFSPVLKWLGLAVCGLAGGYASASHSLTTQVGVVAIALVVLLNIDAIRLHVQLQKQDR